MRSSIMDPTVLTALIVNLEPYSLYDVQVAAVNDAGAGPRSLEVTIETPRASQYCGYANIYYMGTPTEIIKLSEHVFYEICCLLYT